MVELFEYYWMWFIYILFFECTAKILSKPKIPEREVSFYEALKKKIYFSILDTINLCRK